MTWSGKSLLRLVVLLLGSFSASPAFADREADISLAEVPEQVLAAVRNAQPDIKVQSAARLTDDSGTLYEIEGEVGDDELEFVVRPDGRIVETEKE